MEYNNGGSPKENTLRDDRGARKQNKDKRERLGRKRKTIST